MENKEHSDAQRIADLQAKNTQLRELNKGLGERIDAYREVTPIASEHKRMREALEAIASTAGGVERQGDGPVGIFLFVQSVRHRANQALGRCNGVGCPVNCDGRVYLTDSKKVWILADEEMATVYWSADVSDEDLKTALRKSVEIRHLAKMHASK